GDPPVAVASIPIVPSSDIEPASAGRPDEAATLDPPSFEVFVSFSDGECMPVRTTGSQTIRDLRRAIEARCGRPARKLTLMGRGRELEDDELVSECGVGEGSLLAAQMQIYVHFLNRKGFFLDVDPSVTIAEVKAMIESKDPDNAPASDQRIYPEGRGTNLEDGTDLDRCGVEDGTNLFVLVNHAGAAVPPPRDGRHRVHVRCDRDGRGVVHSLEAAPTESISDVKAALWEKEHVLPDDQRLSFGDMDLEDDRASLWECGVGNDALLHLVRRPGSERRAPPPARGAVGGEGASGAATRGGDKRTLFFVDAAERADPMPMEAKDGLTVREAFEDYAEMIGAPVADLSFFAEEFGELPPDCDIAIGELGLPDGATIRVATRASPLQSMVPNVPGGGRGSDLDLTVFGTAASNSAAEDIAILEVRGVDGETTRVKLDRTFTSLQLAFSSYADRRDADSSSLYYLCGARRFSHETEETPAQCGVDDGDVLHALDAARPTHSAPDEGKISMYVEEIGTPDVREYFRVEVDGPLAPVLEAFAKRRGYDARDLRFFFRGEVLRADEDAEDCPAGRGFGDGDVVHVARKNRSRSPLPVTPNAAATLRKMSSDRVSEPKFEPVMQVVAVDERNEQLTVSDGADSLSLAYDRRLNRLIESGVLRKFAIISLNHIVFEDYMPSNYVLVDADEAAPNPGRVIGALADTSPTSHPDEGRTQQVMEEAPRHPRVGSGLPLSKCHNKSCRAVSGEGVLRRCSQCKVFGYCSEQCQKQSWKDKHKKECRYFVSFNKFLKQMAEDGEETEFADVLSFWTNLQEEMGPTRQLTGDVAASLCNTLLHCAYGALTSVPMMADSEKEAGAHILHAAVLQQVGQGGTPFSDLVDWYDIGSEGVALDRFLSRVPYLKAGHDAIESKESMLDYLNSVDAHDGNIVGCSIFHGNVWLQLKRSDTGKVVSFYWALNKDFASGMSRIQESFPSNLLQYTFEGEDDQTVKIDPHVHTTPHDVGMKSRGEYTIVITPLDEQERLRKVKEIVARNVIADFIWRRHEGKAGRVIADFIFHHHKRSKAKKIIAGLIWRKIAGQRRQRLRGYAQTIQKLQRGHSARKLHLGMVQQRLEEFRKFTATWKHTIGLVPTSLGTLTDWALVREGLDVKKVELLDEDGNLADTDDKLSRALTGALNEEKKDEPLDETEFDEALPEENSVLAEEGPVIKIDWSQFQVTSHVVKFMKNGDAKYREIFVKKMKQLAKGERSHKLMKPLKGCSSIIYESYLENKSGFRILWTQEGETLVVWFIAKHKSVSRLAKLIDDARNRSSRQQLPQNFVTELDDNVEPSNAKKEVLLDALGNVPIKLYDVPFDNGTLDENVDRIVKDSWTPQMHLTDEEREVVEARGTVLLLGRSGTGKTVCICNRIEFDRQRFGRKHNFSQLFLSRSAKLCSYVEKAVGKCPGSTFTTFDRHVRVLQSKLCVNGSFHPRQHVDFARFNREFFAERYPQEHGSALIVWKAIRTFLKGSIEAFQTSDGFLSREYFVSGKLGKNRCKVPSDRRGWIYDVFSQYALYLSEQHLWDDCDLMLALIKGIEHAKKCDASLYEEDIKRSKIYVDEVQDYLQIEILLFFYIGGSPGSLFLAGDPAQSVVEGTEFRFEEVRSVGYFVSGKDRRDLIPEKPKVVNVNFRSHAGVLNCAGGFLDLLFRYFPGSAKQLKKDFGLFKGARPGVFQGVEVAQLSALLREKMPGAVVLTHDESASQWKELLDHPLVYGIREAKGLEVSRDALFAAANAAAHGCPGCLQDRCHAPIGRPVGGKSRWLPSLFCSHLF
ncbi:hypothetical protein ACHAWF_015633, partial [Thalassiosira exigua]